MQKPRLQLMQTAITGTEMDSEMIMSKYETYECYCISRPIRRTVIFSLEILEKNDDKCILILVIYWKKTGLLHTKISRSQALMPDLMIWKQISISHKKDVV